MGNSAFNPSSFLGMESAQAMDTSYTPMPAAEYDGIVKDVIARTVGKDDSPVLTCVYKLVNVDDLKASLKIAADKDIEIRQDFWLDLNESGGFDIGPNKNVKLGMLRDALGQNRPGEPWSPLMMKGQGPVKLQVTIKNVNGEDFNEVKRVARII